MARAILVGDWLVEPDFNRIRRDDLITPLQPRLMSLLVCLAEQAGELVTKDQLVATVWTGVVVTDNAITRAISQLRFALGDDPRSPRFIATVPTKGYYLVASVRLPEPAALQPTQEKPVPATSPTMEIVDATPCGTAMAGLSQLWAWLRRTTVTLHGRRAQHAENAGNRQFTPRD